MYHGTKSSIQERFQMCELPDYNQNNLALIIEASPLLRNLSSISVETFNDVAVVFYQHVNRLAEDFQRLDIVFNHHFSNCFKSQTQMGRGGGGTHVFRINDGIPIPYNFLNSFLSNSANKNNIGLYLAKKLVYIHNECGNTLLKLSVTYEDRTISIPTLIDTSVVDSTAEEGNQQLVRDTLHCITEKYSVIKVQSTDTQFLVLLLV